MLGTQLLKPKHVQSLKSWESKSGQFSYVFENNNFMVKLAHDLLLQRKKSIGAIHKPRGHFRGEGLAIFSAPYFRLCFMFSIFFFFEKLATLPNEF